MPPQTLAAAKTMIESLVGDDNVTVIMADHRVLQVSGFIHPEPIICDNPLDDCRDEFASGFIGGGGTDFNAAFEWIEKHFDKPVDHVVYLTDGYSIPLKREYFMDTTWLLADTTLSDYEFRGICSWGRIIRLAPAITETNGG